MVEAQKIKLAHNFKLYNKMNRTKFLSQTIYLAFCLTALTVLLSATTFAQERTRKIPSDVVPPPLQLISEEEADLLKVETKMKTRTKLSLELMNARLDKSEEFLENGEHQKSLNQVGRFQALLKDALKFLKRNQGRKGSLKNFKKIELHLRDVLPRLEIIRRNIPYKYGYNVEDVMIYVRDARTVALNPLFDDTVLPQADNQ